MSFIQENLPVLLAGISVGGQYALIAIGYTMVYGILRLINFAHGDVFMVAGLVMVDPLIGCAVECSMPRSMTFVRAIGKYKKIGIYHRKNLWQRTMGGREGLRR